MTKAAVLKSCRARPIAASLRDCERACGVGPLFWKLELTSLSPAGLIGIGHSTSLAARYGRRIKLAGDTLPLSGPFKKLHGKVDPLMRPRKFGDDDIAVIIQNSAKAMQRARRCEADLDAFAPYDSVLQQPPRVRTHDDSVLNP